MPSMRLQRPLLLLALVACLNTPAFGQETILFMSDTLKAVDRVADHTFAPPSRSAGKTGAASAVFIIDFSDDFPAPARNTLQAAADLWGSHIQSSVPITIKAEWNDLSGNNLGTAGPRLVSVSGLPRPQTWYPKALVKAMGINDPFPNLPDIEAVFDSSRADWYFGAVGDQASPFSYDFLTVALHELGHGLGFTGSFQVDDGDAGNTDECPQGPAGVGCWGIGSSNSNSTLPIIFDRFTEDQNEVPLLNESAYPNNSAQLRDVLQGGNVFFDGPASRPSNRDVPITLYAPATFDPGASYSHLDEDVFGAELTPTSTTTNSLMTPSLSKAEEIHTPGPVVCGMFQDMGWTLGSDCLELVSTPTDEETPLAVAYDITGFAPNPVAHEARATLLVRQGQHVYAEVYNSLGHRITRLLDQTVSPNQEITLHVAPNGWAAGVYFVRIVGETFTAHQPIVVVGR